MSSFADAGDLTTREASEPGRCLCAWDGDELTHECQRHAEQRLRYAGTLERERDEARDNSRCQLCHCCGDAPDRHGEILAERVAELDEAGRQVAVCHEIIQRARCLIDPEEHPDWDRASYEETSKCDRLQAERDEARALLREMLESMTECVRFFRGPRPAAISDHWIEDAIDILARVRKALKERA